MTSVKVITLWQFSGRQLLLGLGLGPAMPSSTIVHHCAPSPHRHYPRHLSGLSFIPLSTSFTIDEEAISPVFPHNLLFKVRPLRIDPCEHRAIAPQRSTRASSIRPAACIDHQGFDQPIIIPDRHASLRFLFPCKSTKFPTRYSPPSPARSLAMADDLDSIVKGTASAPTEKAAQNVTNSTSGVTPASGKPGDPLSHAPSSPSMIYLNLLVLEASLRAQYLELRARRRHHTFFLAILSVWIVGFGYALFLAPREDGRGVGGSVYWGVEMIEKLCFMGGIITAILVWATGIWERGVRWPRRWFAISNRGLRGFNLKLVLVKRPWWVEALATLGFFLTYGLFSHTAGSSYQYVDPAILKEVEKEMDLTGKGHQHIPIILGDEEKAGHEEDLASGGDYVKLLLLAKPFSPTFRENWELYRTEYWERENERRALIQNKLKQRERRLRKETMGWFWWLPWMRLTPVVEKQQQPQQQQQQQHLHPDKAHHRRLSVVDREVKRSRSGSNRRGSFSGPSSRSPTPGLEVREGSSSRRSSNASEKRKKNLSTSGSKSGKRPGVESRSITPEFPSPLARESSVSVMMPKDPAAASNRRGKSSSDPV